MIPEKAVQDTVVPELGLGTYKLYGTECYRAVRTALDLGYRHFDTAQMYKNEQEIGRAISLSGVPREKLFLTTKVWHTDLEHDDLLRAAETSLAELDTPYVDLLLIHWPNPQVELERSLEAMLTLRDQGKAERLGVSNFTLPMVRRIVEEFNFPLFCNQVEFHPYLDQFDLLDFSYDHDLLLTAHTPLARGEAVKDDTLKSIGSEYGKSAAQVALRWLIEQDLVAAIPKASSREHLEENMDLYDFSLSDEHFDRIDRLGKVRRLVNPAFAPEWDKAG